MPIFWPVNPSNSLQSAQLPQCLITYSLEEFMLLSLLRENSLVWVMPIRLLGTASMGGFHWKHEIRKIKIKWKLKTWAVRHKTWEWQFRNHHKLKAVEWASVLSSSSSQKQKHCDPELGGLRWKVSRLQEVATWKEELKTAQTLFTLKLLLMCTAKHIFLLPEGIIQMPCSLEFQSLCLFN